jgi:hypothetical protein
MTTQTSNTPASVGKLALEFCKKSLPLEVMKSATGYYIGTSDEGMPCSRESNEYYRTEALALKAFEGSCWTQKSNP